MKAFMVDPWALAKNQADSWVILIINQKRESEKKVAQARTQTINVQSKSFMETATIHQQKHPSENLALHNEQARMEVKVGAGFLRSVKKS